MESQPRDGSRGSGSAAADGQRGRPRKRAISACVESVDWNRVDFLRFRTGGTLENPGQAARIFCSEMGIPLQLAERLHDEQLLQFVLAGQWLTTQVLERPPAEVEAEIGQLPQADKDLVLALFDSDAPNPIQDTVERVRAVVESSMTSEFFRFSSNGGQNAQGPPLESLLDPSMRGAQSGSLQGPGGLPGQATIPVQGRPQQLTWAASSAPAGGPAGPFITTNARVTQEVQQTGSVAGQGFNRNGALARPMLVQAVRPPSGGWPGPGQIRHFPGPGTQGTWSIPGPPAGAEGLASGGGDPFSGGGGAVDRFGPQITGASGAVSRAQEAVGPGPAVWGVGEQPGNQTLGPGHWVRGQEVWPTAGPVPLPQPGAASGTRPIPAQFIGAGASGPGGGIGGGPPQGLLAGADVWSSLAGQLNAAGASGAEQSPVLVPLLQTVLLQISSLTARVEAQPIRRKLRTLAEVDNLLTERNINPMSLPAILAGLTAEEAAAIEGTVISTSYQDKEKQKWEDTVKQENKHHALSRDSASAEFVNAAGYQGLVEVRSHSFAIRFLQKFSVASDAEVMGQTLARAMKFLNRGVPTDSWAGKRLVSLITMRELRQNVLGRTKEFAGLRGRLVECVRNTMQHKVAFFREGFPDPSLSMEKIILTMSAQVVLAVKFAEEVFLFVEQAHGSLEQEEVMSATLATFMRAALVEDPGLFRDPQQLQAENERIRQETLIVREAVRAAKLESALTSAGEPQHKGKALVPEVGDRQAQRGGAGGGFAYRAGGAYTPTPAPVGDRHRAQHHARRGRSPDKEAEEPLIIPRSPWLLGNHGVTYERWPGVFKCRQPTCVGDPLHGYLECPYLYDLKRRKCPGFRWQGGRMVRDEKAWDESGNNLSLEARLQWKELCNEHPKLLGHRSWSNAEFGRNWEPDWSGPNRSSPHQGGEAP